MDFAVLMKVVPALDDLAFDPVRRTVVREGAELFLNPFDQRALQVALQLHRPGEHVSVVSLGPPPASGPLRDASAVGADRVLLLSDPRFAGSDTLATARALVAGLQRVGHEVVLGGTWTTDSETGQVGPEVAALLRVPVLTGARAVVRDPAGSGLTVTVDTPSGWATYRARAPLVVTVGEKITKPGKVAPEDRARVPLSAVEVLTLDDLGLSAGAVGLAGSPTVGTVGHRRLAPPGTGRDRGREPSGARCPGRRGPPSPSRAAGGGVPELASPFDPARGGTGGARARHGCVGIARPFDARDPLGGPSVPAGPLALRRLGRTLPHAGRGRPARPAGAAAGYCCPLSPLPSDSRTVAEAFGVALDHRPAAAGAVFLADPFGRETAAQLAAARSLGLTGERDRGSSGGTERDPLVETVVRRSNGRGDLEPYPAEPRHRPAGGLGGAGRRPFDRAVRMDPPPSSPGPGGLGSGRVRDGGRPRDPLARRAGRRGRGRHGDRRPRRRGGPRAAPCPVGRRPRGNAPGGRRGLGSPTAPGRAHGSRPRSPARRAPRGRWSDEPPGRMEAGACAARGQPGPDRTGVPGRRRRDRRYGRGDRSPPRRRGRAAPRPLAGPRARAFSGVHAGEQVVERGPGARGRGGRDAYDKVRSLDVDGDERRVVGSDRGPEPGGFGRARTRPPDNRRHFDFERFFVGGWACGDEPPPFGWAPGPRVSAPGRSAPSGCAASSRRSPARAGTSRSTATPLHPRAACSRNCARPGTGRTPRGSPGPRFP